MTRGAANLSQAPSFCLKRHCSEAAPFTIGGARGGNNGPSTGVTYANGAFYIAEGGQLEGGRILRVTRDGTITRLAEHLPGQGDHHTNGPAVGPDGMIYFGQGTATNSGVVGEDNLKFGWLKRFPKFHDTPCQDITLAGVNYETVDAPAAPDLPRKATRTARHPKSAAQGSKGR